MQLYRRFYGRGPTRAKTVYDGNVLTTVLADIFTTVEQTLVERGRDDLVTETPPRLPGGDAPRVHRARRGAHRPRGGGVHERRRRRARDRDGDVHPRAAGGEARFDGDGPYGILFLGKSELLIRHAERFEPVDLKQRIFRKRPKRAGGDRYAFIAGGPADTAAQPFVPRPIREVALDVGPVAQIATDADGIVVLVNRRARALFGLRSGDLGRPLRDLELSYRPADLRTPIEDASRQRRPVRLATVEFAPPGGQRRRLDIEIVPVLDGGELAGMSITFSDTSTERRLQDQVDASQHQLAGLQQELQSAVEELETTNEELQSTNEELETTNEELQSTNEELETTNEELHSVNAELETTNDELRDRSREVDQVNAFLETVLESMGIAVVVVDRQLRIQVWNDQAEELWGLRPGEVLGEPLMGLDIAFPVERLAAPVRACLQDDAEPPAPFELETTNRRGNAVHVVVRCIRLHAHGDERGGAVIMMEAAPA